MLQSWGGPSPARSWVPISPVCLTPRPHGDRNSSFPKLRVHRSAPCAQVTELLAKAVRVRTVKTLSSACAEAPRVWAPP